MKRETSIKKIFFIFALVISSICVFMEMGMLSTHEASALSQFDSDKVMYEERDLAYNQKGQFYPVTYDGDITPTIEYSRDNNTWYSAEEFPEHFRDTAIIGSYTTYYKLSYDGYEDLQGEYTVRIVKADKPDLDTSKISFSKNASTLEDVSLPDGWEWVVPKTKLAIGTQNAECRYVGEDALNYEETTINTTITFKKTVKETNPWQIVIYIMIPVNIIMTIVYIIHMRNQKFKKKYLENEGLE